MLEPGQSITFAIPFTIPQDIKPGTYKSQAGLVYFVQEDGAWTKVETARNSPRDFEIIAFGTISVTPTTTISGSSTKDLAVDFALLVAFVSLVLPLLVTIIWARRKSMSLFRAAAIYACLALSISAIALAVLAIGLFTRSSFLVTAGSGSLVLTTIMGSISLVVLLGVAAIWVYGDAEKRVSTHRSLWTIFVILAPVIGFVLYLVFRRKRADSLLSSSVQLSSKSQSAHAVGLLPEMKCPTCGYSKEGETYTGRFFCPNCNETVVYDPEKYEKYQFELRNPKCGGVAEEDSPATDGQTTELEFGSRAQPEHIFGLLKSVYSQPPMVTLVLLLANFLMFLVSLIKFEVILQDLGLSVISLQSGKSWQLLSSMFLHLNFIHLLMNEYGLFILGIPVERVFKEMKTLYLYLGSGIVGNIASYFLLPIGTVSVGASGAVFGLMGADLAMTAVRKTRPAGRQIGATVVYVVITFLQSMGPQINVVAHLAGLCFGFVAGFILARYSSE